MLCNICTIFYNSDDGSCPQCKIYAVDRLFEMTDTNHIDRHIKTHYLNIYKYFINRNNMDACNINNKIKTSLITKKIFMNNLGNYIKSNPEEIILYMSGLTDGMRKCITSQIADIIFSNLIDSYQIFDREEDIFKLIHCIGPFIIDPWNCLYENIYLDEYYVKKNKLVSLENLFNQWTYQNILHYFNPIEYSQCPYCNQTIAINGQNTRCIICNQHFHNQCFSNPFHECKEDHFNHNIDILIENITSL